MWNFLIPAVSSLIGSLAGGRATGRQEAANTNLQRDQLSTQQYQTQQNALIQSLLAAESANMNRANLDLNRREFAQQAPNARGATAVRGDLMSRAQDVQMQGNSRWQPTQISGGARPSMLSPETRQLGQSMTRNALMQQLQGDEFEDVPQQNFGGAVLQPPGQSPLPKANGFDKFLSIAAPIAGIGSAIAGAQQDDRNQSLIEQLLQQAMQSQQPQQQPPMGLPMPPGWKPPQGTLQTPLPSKPIPGWSL